MRTSPNLQKKTDPNNVLLSPVGASQYLAERTDYTEADATAVLLWLDKAGFDILVFGWRHGELHRDDGADSG